MADTKQNPDKITLEAESREIHGTRTRSLRKEGVIPANIYGPNFKSKSVKVDFKDFTHIFKDAGETSIVYINVDGKAIPTLISDIQYHPVSEDILHIDFRKVNLKKKIEAQVPLEFIGESEAVEKKNGVLITQVEEVTVNALPADIPHQIEVDISQLTEIGEVIHASDLPTSDKYELMEEADRAIASITEHKEEEIEPETTVEAPELIGEEGIEGMEIPEEGAPEATAETEEQTKEE